MAIPNKETNLNLGGKTVEDLCEDLNIEGDNIKGISKYIDNWEEFSTINNSGNFLPLYFEEAKGKPDGTVKCLLKGTGVNAKQPKSVDPKDGLFVFKISNNDNTIEITQEGKETRTLNVKELVLLQPVNEVVKPSDASHKTYNKNVEDLQENITVTKDSKITGTLKYVKEYSTGGDYTEGNFIHLHIEQNKLPTGANAENVKFGYAGRTIAPDPSDWNYVMFVDNERKSQKLQLEYNDKVLYSLDLSELTLSPKGDGIKTDKKIEVKNKK